MPKFNNQNTLIILSPGFPADENDTSCLPAQQAFIRSINELYPELRVIILSFQYPYHSKKYLWHGNEVIPFNGQHKRKLLRLLFVWLPVWQTLVTLQKERKPLGLISFWVGESALLGHYFSKYKQLKHITWMLGQDAKKGNRFMKLMRIQPSSLVAMSDFLAKTFHQNYGIQPANVIPNAIFPEQFKLNELARNIDILGVGSLILLKKFDLFIELILQIKVQYPLLKVMICGEGPERAKLEALIVSNQLAETITLMGERSHAEVFDLLQQTKILLHTSEYEGFSGACLEGLYAGAHVLSFQQPMNGWLRNWHVVENKEAMKNKLIALLNDKMLTHQSSTPFQMIDSAKQMLSLFQD